MDPDIRRYLDVTVALLVAVVALLVAGAVTTDVGTILGGAALWVLGFFLVSLYLPAPGEDRPA